MEFRGKKAGWLKRTISRNPGDGSGSWLVEEEGKFLLRAGSKLIEVESMEKSFFSPVPPNGLIEYSSTVTSDGSVSSIRAVARGNAFAVTARKGSTELESTAVLNYALADALAPELMARRGAGPGEETGIVVLLPGTAREERGTARVIEAGPGMDAAVSIETPGFVQTCFLRSGRIVDIRTGPSLEYSEVSRDDALSPWEGLDAARASGTAPAKSGLGMPARKVAGLEVSFAGGAGSRIPCDERQSFEQTKDGSLLVRVKRVGPVEGAAEVPEKVARYLESTAAMPLGDPRIAAAAKEASGAGDLFRRASAVCIWVCRNMKKVTRADVQSAVAVLERLEGDCTEHALLAACLCRAAGIPARTVSGIAWCGDETRTFAFHTWIEAWCGRWVALDPAWGETVADATHIKISEEADLFGLLYFPMDAAPEIISVRGE